MSETYDYPGLDKNKEWKKIKNYDNYLISNYGDIYTINYKRLMKNKKDSDGYFYISLSQNSKKTSHSVHRLVYDTFKTIQKLNTEIDHIDRNTSNNFLGNLREVTKSENLKNKNKYIQTPNIIHQYSLDGVFIKQWNSYEEIAKELGYNAGHVGGCANGRYKQAYGFVWKNMNIVENMDEYKPLVTDHIGETYSRYKINKNGDIIGRNNIKMTPHNSKGYLAIHLKSDSKKGKTFRVHRLVALTFLENKNDNLIVNHIDEDKSNTDSSNLEWTTHKQNIIHSQGKKVNQIDIKTNKVIKTFNCIRDAFDELKKPISSNISKVCLGKRETTYGYKWSFA